MNSKYWISFFLIVIITQSIFSIEFTLSDPIEIQNFKRKSDEEIIKEFGKEFGMECIKEFDKLMVKKIKNTNELIKKYEKDKENIEKHYTLTTTINQFKGNTKITIDESKEKRLNRLDITTNSKLEDLQKKYNQDMMNFLKNKCTIKLSSEKVTNFATALKNIAG